MAELPQDHHCPWREEAERLGARVAALEPLQQQVVVLQEQLEKLTPHIFGKKSEKLPRVAASMPKPTAEEAYAKTQALRQANAEAKKELPQRQVQHVIAEVSRKCPKCGSRDLRPLGPGKESVVFEYIPPQVERQVHVQEALACRCGEGVLVAPGPDRVIDKCQYGPGFIANVIVQKCVDAIPLYRQGKALARTGVPINRTTLGDLFHTGSAVTQPLYERLLAVIAEQKLVLADETPMPVQAPKKTRRGYVWTFRAGKLVAFRFSPTRSGQTPVDVLGGTPGFLCVDGYTGYNAVTLPEGRRRVGCWAHVRRKFFDASAQTPEAKEMLDLILALYRVEHDVKERGIVGTAEHLALRRSQSVAALEAIRTWLQAQQPNHLPKSPLGEAIRYALGQWEALIEFVNDPELPLDNNLSENALRPVALGRKNYLFVGSDEAGENTAGLYSLIATCEANGINPQEYLADVLIRVQHHPASRIDELLPHRWGKLVQPVDAG
jgi:transposase